MKIQLNFLFLIFYCFIALHSFCSAKVELSDEASVLLSIKAVLIDPLDHLHDWNLTNKNSVHCNWTGISCNSNGAVEKIELTHLNLSGILSENIQSLQSLTFLNVCCNGFSSPLPRSLWNFTSIQTIDLSQNFFVDSFPFGLGKADGLTLLNASSNNFSGYIPEDLGNATSLETLDLRGNFFEGSIPKSIKNLENLKFLGLSGNNLTGQIPRELGQLSSLESIIIGYNEFKGEIPKEFGNLTKLNYLDLAVANLGGSIPAELGKLKLLSTIFLYKNNLEGKIPATFGGLTSLTLLDLSDNLLTGVIPDEISECKNLQLLNLMCNHLSGPVPYGLGELTQLSVLELWNNTMSGPLPENLGRSSPLQWLDISSNSFSGEIPVNLCTAGNLTKLILFNNAFSGQIPASLSSCVSLVRVRMQNNNLSGTIPAGFGKLAKLQRLELSNNSLTGQIPSDLSLSASLSFIDFSKNRLQSNLPSSLMSIPNLENFLVSDNELVGEIPYQLQGCPSLSILDLSSNHFTGTIPASIASCEKLVSLNLGNNNLTGLIPTSIANMPTLAILDLSNNSLTGGIPESFGNSPALEMLDVSYNNLEGPVPANGMLRTINPNDLAGNKGLCGSVLPPCTETSAQISRQKKSHTKHVLASWMIGISATLVFLITILGLHSIYKRWYTNGSCFDKQFEMSHKNWPWRLVAFQKLGFTSNDILSSIKESNVIGMGATGIVYKSEIQRLNTIVAIKKLWKLSAGDIEAGGSADFAGEVNVLGKLRHRNIVRLLGYLHNKTESMIIYEYMENGSLGETLHGAQGGRLLFDWVSRYNIAVGVAQGLLYLHHDCHPPVIHRDVKSNNILLDANLDARIADFGLAKMMIKKNETVSVVAGSYGYIAPEYGYTLKVDEKSDIYSYGVVLMELLTGRRPIDPEFGESVDIVGWIRKKLRENKPLEEALDPNVGNCKHVQEEMLLVLRIALICTAALPKDRPSMRDVITMLDEAKPRRKSNSDNGGNSVSKDTPVFSTSPVNGLL